MIRRRHFLGLAAAGMMTRPAGAAPTPGSHGLAVQDVLELFTSQGCSSCPPADRLFQTLAREPGILALSLPVTIWDHLGWKDTLAQPVFSDRQKGYGVTRGDRQIYTPQAVVNGVAHAVGSDQKALDGARKDSRAGGKVMSLTPTLAFDGTCWSVLLPAGSGPASVMLVRFQRLKAVEIGRGENTGRTVKYGNVVQSISQIGSYAGQPVAITVPTEARVTAEESFALLVQDGNDRHPGAILGAVEAPRIATS